MKLNLPGEARDGVGESPFWDADDRVVWSVDIAGSRILRRAWPSGEGGSPLADTWWSDAQLGNRM